MDILNVSKSIFDPFGGYYKNYPIITDTLVLVDSFDITHVRTISQSLTFFDGFVLAGDHDESLSDTLTFVSDFSVGGQITLSDSISFSDSFVSHDTHLTLSDILTLTQTYTKSFNPRSAYSDILLLDDTFSIAYATALTISDDLSLVDSIGLHGHYTIALFDILNLSEDHVNIIFDNNVISIDSWQIIKVSTADFTPFILLNSLTSAIMLESPVFGDLQASINEIMVNRTINGSRYSYIKTSKRKHLKYEFNLRCDKYLELLDFIDQAILDWITLTNWKNEIWRVQIINDDLQLKAPSRDIYSIVLEFEGYLLNTGIYKCLE